MGSNSKIKEAAAARHVYWHFKPKIRRINIWTSVCCCSTDHDFHAVLFYVYNSGSPECFHLVGFHPGWAHSQKLWCFSSGRPSCDRVSSQAPPLADAFQLQTLFPHRTCAGTRSQGMCSSLMSPLGYQNVCSIRVCAWWWGVNDLSTHLTKQSH